MKRNFLLLLIFVLVVIAISEGIGFQSIPIGKFNIGLLPLVFAIIITMVLGIRIFRKGIIKKNL